MRFHLGILVLVVLSFQPLAQACTSFLIHDGQNAFLGKTYDWVQDAGYILGNKRNVLKKGYFTPEIQENPAQWVSKYSSMTFNQYGREFPNGGLNEAGLAVEILWLEASEYPAFDGRPALNELQWVQYQLDNFASTADLVKAADEIRIRNIYAKTHYFVCDASGDCAVLEYLGGKLYVTTRTQLPYSLITNDTYADSLSYLKKHESFGGTVPIPAGDESLDRFVRAAANMKCTEATAGCGMKVLNAVTVTSGIEPTMWKTLYDLKHQTITFSTFTNDKLRTLSASLNSSNCRSPVLGLNLEKSLSGDVTNQFLEFTDEDNFALLMKSFSDLGVLGEEFAKLVAAYPATTQCLE